MKLQLVIEIDKLPDMQGTFAETKDCVSEKGGLVSTSNCFRSLIFSNILPSFLFLFVCCLFLVNEITKWN